MRDPVRTVRTLLVGLVSIGLVAAACSNAGGADDGELAEPLQATTANLAEGYRRAAGIWPGFEPGEHPTIIPFRVGDRIDAALAVNHPKPGDLGTAIELDTEGTPFESLHRIDDLTDEASDRLVRVDAFDFHVELGGVDAFVLVSDAADSFLDSTTAEWTATFMHELFHRYQDDAFAGSLGAQDVEGYAYAAENLELAVLEDRALAAALQATTAQEREAAARRFAGLRLAREQADERVTLDNAQEMFEGTARYIEHRLSGDDRRYGYHDGNYDGELLVSFGLGGVKDSFGFGRFYASGAAILRVLDLLGVDDVPKRVEAGEAPAAIVVDHLGITAADAPALVAEAKASYDPDGTLAAEAAEAATAAESEPPVFGDESGGDVAGDGADGEGSAGEGEGEVIELTDEQLACLDEADIPESGESGDSGEVPDDVWERCVGA